jgi:hypothetical protein
MTEVDCIVESERRRWHVSSQTEKSHRSDPLYKPPTPMLPQHLQVYIFVFLCVLVGACSGPATISSPSMTEAPSVDGSLEEWDGQLSQVGDEAVSVASAPTDSLLYVAVLVQDRALVQSIAANGLVLWVDPSGKQRRTYGVQYPLGLRRQQARQDERGTEASAGEGLDAVSLSELEVVRGDTSRHRIPAQFSSGLRGHATLDPSALVYELAIPVGSAQGASQQHGLRASLDGPVGLGLQIPQPDEEPEIQDRGQTTPSVTGSGGRRRRPGGRRRTPPPQQSPSSERPSLDVWMRVVPVGGS